jgi:hypothetical protein
MATLWAAIVGYLTALLPYIKDVLTGVAGAYVENQREQVKVLQSEVDDAKKASAIDTAVAATPVDELRNELK